MPKHYFNHAAISYRNFAGISLIFFFAVFFSACRNNTTCLPLNWGGGTNDPFTPPGGGRTYIIVNPGMDLDVLGQLRWLHDLSNPNPPVGGTHYYKIVAWNTIQAYNPITSAPGERPIPGPSALDPHSIDFGLTQNVNVIITSETNVRRTIAFDSGILGYMLRVATTNTLSLENIYLEGTTGNTDSLIAVYGTLVMEDAHIFGNTVARGVRADGGNVVMRNGAQIRNNSGGVLLNNNAALTMQGNAQIRQNIAANGGGVHMSAGSTLTMNDNSNIYDNYSTAAVGVSNGGGGVWASGNGTVITMNDSARIQGNGSISHGGGIFMQNQAFLEMRNDSWIYDNTSAVTATALIPVNGVNGGGVSADNSSITMRNNSKIKNNFNNSNSAGGGVNLIRGSTLLMENNSSITGNIVQNSGGGGVRAAWPDPIPPTPPRNYVRMYHTASITNNDTSHSGGGLQIQAHSSLYMLGNDTRISGNRAGITGGTGFGASQGGGVALTVGTSLLRIFGGRIYGIVDPLGTGHSFGCLRVESNTARHSTANQRRHALNSLGTATLYVWDGTNLIPGAPLGHSSSDIVVEYGVLMFPLIP